MIDWLTVIAALMVGIGTLIDGIANLIIAIKRKPPKRAK